MDMRKIKEIAPAVLFVTGCIGVVATAVCSGRDTLKAEKVLYDHVHEEREETRQYFEKGSKVKEYVEDTCDIVKTTWKCYIPTAVVGGITLSLLIASNIMDARKIAALSTAVASSAGLVTKYRDKIREYADEEVLHQIDKDIAKEEILHAKSPRITNHYLCSSNDEMDLNDDGEYLFFDPFTRMKFKASKLAFLGAKYYLNRNFAIGCGAPLTMFYQFLGLEIPEEYKYAGWDMDDFIEDGYQWIDIDVVRSDEPDPETGEQYYIIQYEFEPGDTEYSYSYYPAGNPLDEFGSVARG